MQCVKGRLQVYAKVFAGVCAGGEGSLETGRGGDWESGRWGDGENWTTKDTEGRPGEAGMSFVFFVVVDGFFSRGRRKAWGFRGLSRSERRLCD